MWTQRSRYTRKTYETNDSWLSFQPERFDQILSSYHLLDLSNALRHALKLTVLGCICSVRSLPVSCSSFCQPRSMARLFSQWLPLAHALIITFRLVPLVPERLEWIILYRWLAFDSFNSFDAFALSFKRAKVLCHSDDRKHAVASAEDSAFNSELWCPSRTGLGTWQTKTVISNPAATM